MVGMRIGLPPRTVHTDLSNVPEYTSFLYLHVTARVKMMG